MQDLRIMDFPQRIVIELTPQCNLSCPMCPRHYINENKGDMKWDLWRKLVDEIAENAPNAIVLPFWRGESLLHPEFIKLIEYALNKSIRIHISTNGHCVTKQHADVLSHCEFVTFSIHSIIGYKRAKEFLSLKRNGNLTIQISFVKGEQTTEKLLTEIVGDKDLGGFDSVRLYDEHTKEGIFGRSGYSFKVPRTFCPKLKDTIVIAFDGTISRCNHIWKAESEINLISKSIEEAWNSEHLWHVRENYPDTLCGPCDQWIGHTCGESWKKVNNIVEHKIINPMGTVHV